MTESPKTGSPKLLIVDDLVDIRRLLRAWAEMEGYQPLEAGNGNQAVEIALSEKPEVIIMDIMMPGKDGLTAIKEIRQADPITGIVVLTAYGTEQRAVQAMRVGADDYMHKPFDATELRVKLASVLQKQHLRIENQRLQSRLNNILEHFMPRSVIDQLMSAPDMPQLGGVRQSVSVLFADIRGFSIYAEQTDPETLVATVNRYLGVATDAILKHSGTIDKYLGDGLLAIFNSPIRYEDHALRAVRAACDIRRNVEVLNASPEGRGLQYGVGVHTGEAVIGNIGTPELMNFTAVGESVNLCKQIEEITGPGQIAVSRATVTEIGPDRLLLRAMPPMTVKGRSEPAEVFEVLGVK
ncbi:MAG TPA: response regulator [Anaerolineae bacterium]|nr:response regulator [Anaerolineae bacterium]